jgi:hypothetical protein
MADLLEALNRLLKQGNDPNDPIMRELQRLIEEGAPAPPMPQIERPTPKPMAPNDIRPNWEEEARLEKELSELPTAPEDLQYQRDLDKLTQERPGSPDLPSDEAIETYENMGRSDDVIQEFLNRWGVARAENPQEPDPNEIPMPRPRYPDMEEGVMGLEPLHPSDIRGNLRASDIKRRERDEFTTSEELDDLMEMLAPGEKEKYHDWEDEDEDEE